MTALLLASAPETEYGYVKRLAEKADLLVCADGGIRHATACGWKPDLVIGDFDSGKKPEDCRVIQLCPEKDDSDLMSCVKTIVSEGADTIWLACASGGRIDHFLANLTLLEYLQQQGIQAVLYDSQNRVTCNCGGTQTYQTSPEFQYVGIIPLDERLTGVTLRGLKYELTDAELSRSAVISVSNEAVAPTYTITIKSGRALVIESHD